MVTPVLLSGGVVPGGMLSISALSAAAVDPLVAEQLDPPAPLQVHTPLRAIPGGSASARVTPVAALGPVLLTVIV
jgi:hypothetical protein